MDGRPPGTVVAHGEHDHRAEERARGLPRTRDVRPDWVFAWFTENARACIAASDAVAALLTQPSAQRLLPGWPWVPLVDPGISLPTWIARQPQVRAVVAQVADAFATAPKPAFTDAAEPSIGGAG